MRVNVSSLQPPFNRDPIDRLIASELSKYNYKFFRQLRRADDPINDVGLWRGYGLGLISTMEPHLAAAHEKQFDSYNRLYGLPVDKSDYEAAYNGYAQAELGAYALLSAHNAQLFVRDIYNRAMSEGWSEATVLERLLQRFGPSAAEAIGSTELTRLLAFGSSLIVDLLKDAGISAYQVWYTIPDERRCAICAALHGKTREVWVQYGQDDGPPAHPRCRCWAIVTGLTLLGR